MIYYYIVPIASATEADFNKSTSTRETVVSHGDYYVFKKAEGLPKWEIPHRLYTRKEIDEALNDLSSSID